MNSSNSGSGGSKNIKEKRRKEKKNGGICRKLGTRYRVQTAGTIQATTILIRRAQEKIISSKIW